MRSFLEHGHQVHVYTDEDRLAGLPDGATQMSASEVLRWDPAFDKQATGHPTFADLFRYTLLAKKGGWWCDCDVIALRPFPRPKHVLFASERHGDGKAYPMPSVLFAEPGDPVMCHLRDTALSRDPASIQWCELGPDLLRRVVKEQGLQDRVADAAAFCPLDMADWLNAILPGKAPEFGVNSFAVHLWHEIWKRHRVPKDQPYPPNCLFEILKRRYGVL